MKTKLALFVLLVGAITACFLASCGGSSAANTNADTPPLPSTLTFNISDGCEDGETVYLRFFDVTDNLQWPANTSQAYVLNYDNSYTYNLSCNTGDKICYGASDQTWYWGVGADDSESCPNCCWSCENSAESLELVCTSAADDRAKEKPGTQHAQRIPGPTSYLSSPPGLGPRWAGSAEALHAQMITVRGGTPCGKDRGLGIRGRQALYTMRPAFALWGTLPLGARPTWSWGLVSSDGNRG